jgi:hypothetical protein
MTTRTADAYGNGDDHQASCDFRCKFATHTLEPTARQASGSL